jgi:hypothetical protein
VVRGYETIHYRQLAWPRLPGEILGLFAGIEVKPFDLE